RVRLHPATGDALEVDQREYLLDAARRHVRDRSEHTEVIAARPPGVQVGRLENGSDTSRGSLELGERSAEDEGPAMSRLGQAEQHPQRRRLACAVRAEEP